MTHLSRLVAWYACALLLTACGGGGGGNSGSAGSTVSSGSSAPAATLDTIAATPSTLTLAVGATQALTVTGTYSNATTATLTTGLTFVSGNAAVATVSASGVVTAVAAGTTQVTVTDASAAAPTTPVTVTVSAAAASAGNALSVVVDSGPPALLAANPPSPDADILFATVTICTPGSANACQVIDHVQVDTGSTGLAIISSVLTGAAVPLPQSVNGSPLRECLAYADGYAWGSMATVDVQIGGRTIANLPVNIIGDPAAGAAPASCTSGYTSAQDESSVAAFGANGILGIGYFLQDCGAACVTAPAPAQAYYACPAAGCTPTIVPAAQQMTNPISALAADNNGMVIVLPAIAAPGAASANGTVYFGIGTQANNALGSAHLLTVVDIGSNAGTLTTTFNGATLTGSVIDSGSSGFFFNDSSIPTCTDYTNFYCPVSGGAPTTLALNATISGENGVSVPEPFSIGNTDSLFSNTTLLAALPTLGGPNGALNNIIPGFDWGLPFFFGKSVFVLFETQPVGAITGPAVGL